jgi:choline-sulfatase
VHSHGMYDCTHTVDDARARFRTELPTWSQSLNRAGYHCAYFGKWHVERSNELSRFGWQHQLRDDYAKWRHERGFGDAPRPAMLKELGGTRGYRKSALYGVTDDAADATSTAHIFNRGAEYLENELRPDRPWCLFLSTNAPHDPYIAPRQFYDMYDPSAIPRPASFDDDLRGKPNVLKRMQGVWSELSWDDFAQATCCFYATCSMIDAQVGRVLDSLERTGQRDNTVIIFLADHGDMMGAHRLLTKGATPYEEVYNVPLLISAPDSAAHGSDCDRIVSLGDVCPTVLDLAGVEQSAPCHFRSLVPLLDDPLGPGWRDEAYAEFHGQRYFFTQRIIWHGNLKYILNAYDFDEMYDLQADPAELNNVVDDPAYAKAKESMLKAIWTKIRETNDETLANAHYWTLRFFDLGPDCVEH